MRIPTVQLLLRNGNLDATMTYRARSSNECVSYVRASPASAQNASSRFAMRAVRRSVASFASGSFSVRRPQAARHCRASKAALS